MSFCPKCGNEVSENDKFCMKCGADLSDLKEDESKEVITENVTTSKESFEKNTVKDSEDPLKETLNLFVGIIKKPLDAVTEFMQNGTKNAAIISFAAVILIQGLIGIFKVKQMTSSIEKGGIKFISLISQYFSSILGSDLPNNSDISEVQTALSKFKSILHISYGTIFFHTVLLYLVAFIILFISIYIFVNTVLKKNIDSFKLFKSISSSSIILIYSELVALLFGFINNYISLAIIAFGMLLFILLFYEVCSAEIDQRTTGMLISMSIGITITYLIVAAVFFSLLKSDLSSFIMNIIRNGSNLFN
jgi:hypothetical protein